MEPEGLLLELVLLLQLVVGSENMPVPLVFSPATLTLYSVPDSRPLSVAAVTRGSSWGCRSNLSVLNMESSRVQPVMGLVVLSVMLGGCREGRG